MDDLRRGSGIKERLEKFEKYYWEHIIICKVAGAFRALAKVVDVQEKSSSELCAGKD